MTQQVQGSANRTIGDYVIGKTIGKGTFGKVKLGTHTLTGELVAVKILEKSRIQDEADKTRVAREIQILRKVKHPNIIQLYEIIETPTKLFLITEYATGGELFQYIVKNERLDQFQSSRILQQILNAVEYLHLHGIAHRDLKPENLLLDQKNNIKVVDFGLSNLYSSEDDLLATACGSPCYAAPEMVSGKQYQGLKTDIWSCGIILYAMLCGYLPFQDPDTAELYKKIRAGVYELPAFVSFTAKDILQKILNTNPQKRATIASIRAHTFCLKKEPQIQATLSSTSLMPIQDNIVAEIKGHNFTNIQEQIQNNKHNRATATYYLLLKSHLGSQGLTMLDYWRNKELGTINLDRLTRQKSNVSIRKRKPLQLGQAAERPKIPIKSNLNTQRPMLAYDEVRQTQSRQVRRETTTASKQLISNPPSPYKQDSNKKPLSLNNRPRMKSQIGQGGLSNKVIMTSQVAQLLKNKQRVLITNLKSNTQSPSPSGYATKNTHLNKLIQGQSEEFRRNEEEIMLNRIYRKNIGKLQPSAPTSVRIRTKSKQ